MDDNVAAFVVICTIITVHSMWLLSSYKCFLSTSLLSSSWKQDPLISNWILNNGNHFFDFVLFIGSARLPFYGIRFELNVFIYIFEPNENILLVILFCFYFTFLISLHCKYVLQSSLFIWIRKTFRNIRIHSIRRVLGGDIFIRNMFVFFFVPKFIYRCPFIPLLVLSMMIIVHLALRRYFRIFSAQNFYGVRFLSACSAHLHPTRTMQNWPLLPSFHVLYLVLFGGVRPFP